MTALNDAERKQFVADLKGTKEGKGKGTGLPRTTTTRVQESAVNVPADAKGQAALLLRG